MDTADLNVVLGGNCFESLLVLREKGQADVDRASQRSSEVSRARSDVAEVVVV